MILISSTALPLNPSMSSNIIQQQSDVSVDSFILGEQHLLLDGKATEYEILSIGLVRSHCL